MTALELSSPTGEVVDAFDEFVAAWKNEDERHASTKALMAYEAQEARLWEQRGITVEQFADQHLGCGRRQFFHLADRGKVVLAVAGAAGVHRGALDVGDRASRDLKGHLEELTENVKAAVNGLEAEADRAAAAANAVEETREQVRPPKPEEPPTDATQGSHSAPPAPAAHPPRTAPPTEQEAADHAAFCAELDAYMSRKYEDWDAKQAYAAFVTAKAKTKPTVLKRLDAVECAASVPDDVLKSNMAWADDIGDWLDAFRGALRTRMRSHLAVVR